MCSSLWTIRINDDPTTAVAATVVTAADDAVKE
jgi:hypothetical protein